MTIFDEGQPQTVQDMLALRDFREEAQRRLLERFGGNTVLVMFSLVIPGPVKTNPYIRRLFEVGSAALSACLAEAGTEILYTKEYPDAAGDTAFFVTGKTVPQAETQLPEKNAAFAVHTAHQEAALRIKQLCVRLEREHPLGQLWDFDVFSAFGKKLSASDTALPGRTCLLCKKSAKLCARSRAHSVQALQEKITEVFFHYEEALINSNAN